jgi:hypothetical protein
MHTAVAVAICLLFFYFAVNDIREISTFAKDLDYHVSGSGTLIRILGFGLVGIILPGALSFLLMGGQ